MISQFIVLGSIGMIFDHASIVTAVALAVRSIYFFQVYAGQPPAQQATSPDLGSYLLVILTVLGTVITVLGLLFSVYLFYRARIEFSVKVENTVDPAINVLDIYRYPLEEEKWRKFRRSLHFSVALRKRVAITYAFLVPGYLILLIVISLIKFHNESIIIISIIFLIISFIMIPISFILYRYDNARLRELGTTPEEGNRWVMDRAEMAVYADYNYLLAKARWSLKQMKATVITVRSNNVEGILRPSRFSAPWYIIKATIKPDQDDQGTFIILVEFTSTLLDKFIIGKYINSFLDLMGSNGFSPTNPVIEG